MFDMRTVPIDLEETKRALTATIESQKSGLAMWMGFLGAAFCVYWLFSSGDFSFLLVSERNRPSCPSTFAPPDD